jgi:hypothetical protein
MPQSGKHNGKQIALVEFVKANPGRSAGEILAAVGAENRYNVLTLAMKIGAVWPAGPVSYRVYYPTEQEAKDKVAEVRSLYPGWWNNLPPTNNQKEQKE